MSDKSAIQWTDASWNTVYGCTRVSPACARCYIERTPPFRKEGLRFDHSGKIPIKLLPHRMEDPLHWTRPRRIFVNSLSDLFHEDVSDEHIAAVYAVMIRCLRKGHIFQVLTKRPERMRDLVNGRLPELVAKDLEEGAWSSMPKGDPFSEWWKLQNSPWPPPNVWHGVSVENQHWADVRIPLLMETQSAIRWISGEPLLKAVDLGNWLEKKSGIDLRNAPDPVEGKRIMSLAGTALLDWVVVGGESGPGARMINLDHVRRVRDQCIEAGVAYFGKQLGSAWAKKNGADRMGGDWNYWPEDLRIREFPPTPKVAA